MAEAYLFTHVQDFADKRRAVFSVEFKFNPSDVIGMTLMTWDARYEGVGEVGYILGQEFWGRGLATEATRRLLQYGFEMGLVVVPAKMLSRKIITLCWRRNTRLLKIARLYLIEIACRANY